MNFIELFFSPTSIWSFVLQAGVWFGVCMVIIISTDVANPHRGYSKLKQNLGLFLLFLVMGGGLIVVLFGRQTLG